MTANISEDYATDVSGGLRTNGHGKAIIAGMISIMKETIGGGPQGATVTLASDTATIVNDACIFALDTEGAAAADDFKAITIGVSGDLRDGMVAGFYNVNSSRVVTVKNVAGARRIFTKSGRDVVLADTFTIFWAKYKLADDAWYQIFPDVSNMVDLLAGSMPLATVNIASSALVIDRALTYADSGSAMHIDALTAAKHVEGNLIGLCTANATYARTLYHDIGTTDKLDLIGDANIIMAADTWYFFVKTIVSSNVIWKHVWTIYPAGVAVAASTAVGKMSIGNTTGGWKESGGTLAKGSIPVGSSTTDFGYLSVGTNGHIPYADSTEALGIKWAAPGGGGGIYGDGADGAKTISTNTTETVPKIFRLTTLTIQTGCTWTVKSGTLILCSGAVDIQGTGQLVVAADIPGGVGGGNTSSDLWRPHGNGPSPGQGAFSYSVSPNGAGCGGAGGSGGFASAGNAVAGGAAGPAVYPYPGVTGSGGGSNSTQGNAGLPGNGGPGGGSVGLYSGSTITIGASAKITANGGAGTAQSGTYGAGGSGGSGGVIDLGALTSITNNGTIEAKGGAGGNAVNSGYYAPGGGGGIVCLTAPSITAGTITLTGGAVGSGGAAFSTAPTAGSTGVTYSTTATPVKYRCF